MNFEWQNDLMFQNWDIKKLIQNSKFEIQNWVWKYTNKPSKKNPKARSSSLTLRTMLMKSSKNRESKMGKRWFFPAIRQPESPLIKTSHCCFKIFSGCFIVLFRLTKDTRMIYSSLKKVRTPTGDRTGTAIAKIWLSAWAKQFRLKMENCCSATGKIFFWWN